MDALPEMLKSINCDEPRIIPIYGTKMKAQKLFLPTMLVVMTGLLAVLAYLQYTWLGKLSESEQDLMKAILRNSSQRFSEDFDQEMTKLYRNFAGIEPLSEGAASTIETSVHTWEKSEFSPVLKDVFLVIPQTKGVTLKKWIRSTQSLQNAEWTPDSAEVRSICERERD